MKKLRTQKEMVDKIREMKKEDMFGCWTGDLVTYLSFDNSKEFINPVDSEKRYEKFHREYTEENVTAEMKSYLKFAWEKANGQRGLSANRSLIHYQAWFWLLGEDEISDNMFEDYRYYGKERLVEITEWLGLNPNDYDDGIRVNN